MITEQHLARNRLGPPKYSFVWPAGFDAKMWQCIKYNPVGCKYYCRAIGPSDNPSLETTDEGGLPKLLPGAEIS